MAKKRRIVGKVDKLQPALKDTVDQMLMSGESYREIVKYLAENGESITQSSVCRYAQRFLSNAEQLRITQENFRMIMTEIERYPGLDPAEAILRLASQKVYDAVAALDDKEWENVSADKLVGQATALARAAAYKRGVDLKAKNDEEIALEANQSLLYDTLKKENPRLYSELQEEILRLKKKIRDGESSEPNRDRRTDTS